MRGQKFNNWCKLNFSFKSKLNKHIRNRHPEIQSQPNIKSETDCLTSKDESELKYENIKNETVNSKHPTPQILNPEEAKKLFEAGKMDKFCSLCDKSFGNIKSFKHHMETIHEGLKHHCPHCNKEFGYKSNVKKHIRKMHKELDINCDSKL